MSGERKEDEGEGESEDAKIDKNNKNEQNEKNDKPATLEIRLDNG